jgi:acetyl-CoA carboxylase carboxyl transferase subunit alpha
MAEKLKRVLSEQLDYLSELPVDKLLEQRQQRLRSYGQFQE